MFFYKFYRTNKKFDGDIFLIVDEVHGIGAQKIELHFLKFIGSG